MLLGLFIGFLLPSKAAIAVSQVAFFPMAILGGLMMPVDFMPGFVKTISPYFPSRGAGELMWSATVGTSPSAIALIMLVAWTVVAGGLAVWAYRRDEGRRFS